MKMNRSRYYHIHEKISDIMSADGNSHEVMELVMDEFDAVVVPEPEVVTGGQEVMEDDLRVISREELQKLIDGISDDINEGSTAEDILLRITGELGLEVEPEPILPGITQGKWHYDSDDRTVWAGKFDRKHNEVVCRRLHKAGNGKLIAAAPEMAQYLHNVYNDEANDYAGIERVLRKAGVKDL